MTHDLNKTPHITTLLFVDAQMIISDSEYPVQKDEFDRVVEKI